MNINSIGSQKSSPLKVSNNRRSDHTVRTAIDDIQKLLFDPQAPKKIFSLLLQHIADITGSEYGVCFLGGEDGILPLGTAEKKHVKTIHIAQGVEFIHSSHIVSWIDQRVLPTRPVFFNGKTPNSYRSLLLHPEKVQSLLLIPIINHQQIQALCIFGKAEDDYSGDMIRRLMPLVGSVICALQSAHSVKGNLVGFNHKITDNRYLSSLLACSPVGTIVVCPDKTILTANPAAHDIFLGDKLNTQGMAYSYIEQFVPNFNDLFQWSNQRSPYGEKDSVIGPHIWRNQSAYKINGDQFLIDVTVFRYTYGANTYTTLQVQDVTAMRESAEEYQQTVQQLKALTHLVPVGIIRVDIAWSCVYANDKWYEFSGLTGEETSGPNWINAIHSDDVQLFLDDLRQSLQLGQDYQKEVRIVTPLGQIRWVDFNTRVLFDDAGSMIGFLATVQDVTERLINQEKLRHIAEYDRLTGLANRHLFQDRLEQAFFSSERDGVEVSVMFLDLDGFKDVNDALGHDVGDLLLQQVSERLLNTLRKNDTVARFGGDEFVILLGKNEEGSVIEGVASKIIDIIAKPYQLNEQEVFITVSIGIANGTYANSSPKKILKQADAALYMAKREGKNNFQLFSVSLDNESQRRVRLVNQLRYAVTDHKYRLYYQPVSSVSTDKIIGFEALLRFVDDDNKIIQPDHFIPILEETGMVIEAGKWVIEEACRQLCSWQSSGYFPEGGFLSFNVSPKQLLDDTIVNTIKSACERYAIQPHYLVMELTETVIINKPKKVEKILSELKDIGIRLAMDDFGTGYSSLSYLQKYPFDHIKVDRSFVDGLINDENDAKITKAIISLAQSLGLKVTAEGVVDLPSLKLLQGFGADHYQGYFLGKPAPPELAVEFINDPLA